MSDRFRAVAYALSPYLPNARRLVQAVDAVTALDVTSPGQPTIQSPDKNATYNWTNGLWDFDHSYLVNVCKDNDVVLMYVGQSKKINAIKELRRVVPGAGLKACKEAVEDSLVTLAAQLRSDPWHNHGDSDEPPF